MAFFEHFRGRWNVYPRLVRSSSALDAVKIGNHGISAATQDLCFQDVLLFEQKHTGCRGPQANFVCDCPCHDT